MPMWGVRVQPCPWHPRCRRAALRPPSMALLVSSSRNEQDDFVSGLCMRLSLPWAAAPAPPSPQHWKFPSLLPPGSPRASAGLVHQHRATRLLSWGQKAPSVHKAPSDRREIKFSSQISHFFATSPSSLSPPRREGPGQPVLAALGTDAAVPVLFRLRLFLDLRPCLSARPDPLQTGGSCSCGEERGGGRF